MSASKYSASRANVGSRADLNAELELARKNTSAIDRKDGAIAVRLEKRHFVRSAVLRALAPLARFGRAFQ